MLLPTEIVDVHPNARRVLQDRTAFDLSDNDLLMPVVVSFEFMPIRIEDCL